MSKRRRPGRGNRLWYFRAMGSVRVLITGSHGRLGRALCDVLDEENNEDGAPLDVIGATRDELDVTDYFRLCAEMERIEPGVVVNCAAFADVDACESERDRAERVNVAGARNVARAARGAGARLIHLSTDLVFDGAARRPYTESDVPRPLSHYAATKLAGELAVAEAHPEHLILRSSWFFGPRPSHRFPESFIAMLAAGRPIRMVSDRLGSPTYLRDLSRAIGTLIRIPLTGVLHFANRGEPTSRYHFLQRLAERLGVPTASMRPIASAVWDGDVAPRPIFSALDPSRFTILTGQTSRGWEEALEEYVLERAA